MDRVRNKDFSLVDFLDMFHHRLISLFYLAWKRSRIAVNYRYGGLDRFSSQFRSLIGLGTSANRLPQGIAIESLLYFSGLLARRIPSVTAIESAVSHIAGQRAVVQQFIERTLQLSKDECTSVGKANSALGVNTICGSQVYENTSKFRVELGPMGSKDFVNFMPEGRLLHSIFALVRFIVGIEYEFDLCLILKRDQVAPTMLGKSTTGFAPQLGWSTWIKAPDNVLPENQRILFQEADVIAVKAA
jgi:type VI secretion system protein ImpH